MRPARLPPFAIGLAIVGALYVVGIAWPLTQGHLSLLHWLGDRIIADQEQRFDRDKLRTDLGVAGFALGDPVHVRILKRERRLEVYLKRAAGRFERFRSYAICTFS